MRAGTKMGRLREGSDGNMGWDGISIQQRSTTVPTANLGLVPDSDWILQ